MFTPGLEHVESGVWSHAKASSPIPALDLEPEVLGSTLPFNTGKELAVYFVK